MANFPTSISTNANLYIAVNGLQTTLAVAINAVITTITLTSTSGFPTTGYVTINNLEVVSYTGISGSDLTGCTRGADGTVAVSHNAGVTVGATVVAAHHNLLKDEIIAVETALGTGYSPTSRGNLDDLNNVVVPTPATNDLLSFNGTNWVNIVRTGLLTLDQLSDVIVPTPSSADLLYFNGTNWVNFPSAAIATASTIMSRDSNANTKTNHMTENITSTATAAGNTILTVSSSPNQQFTGTTTQTVTLPDATTLVTGFQFTILNRSTGIVSVNNNGAVLQQAIAAGAQTTFTLTSVATANGVWDISTSSASQTAYREDYVVGTALNNYTGSLTVFDLVTPYNVGGHSLVVTLDGDVQTIGATVDYLETNSTRVTFNNALISGEKVSFIFQTATSSGGTVNSGTTGQVAYYPATGPTVSGTSDPTLVPVINLGAANINNILINGGMEVWQRNTTFTTPASGAYTADRWFIGYDGTPTFTISREASVIDSGLYAMKMQITALGGSTGFNMRHTVENFAQFRSKTITYSMRVNSNVANVKLLLNDGFTTSASNAHSGGGTYETLTVTKTCASNTSQMIVYVGFVDTSPSVSIIYCDSAMLVIGSIAGNFVSADPQSELAQCQRYYEKSYLVDTPPGTIETASSQRVVAAQQNTTTVVSQEIPFKVPKRATPTIVLYRDNQTNVTGTWRWDTTAGGTNARATATDQIRLHGFTVVQTVALEYIGYGGWTADAEL